MRESTERPLYDESRDLVLGGACLLVQHGSFGEHSEDVSNAAVGDPDLGTI